MLVFVASGSKRTLAYGSAVPLKSLGCKSCASMSRTVRMPAIASYNIVKCRVPRKSSEAIDGCLCGEFWEDIFRKSFLIFRRQVKSVTWYSDVSIFVWSSFACIEAIFGLAGLVVVSTTCLSDRTIGIELTDRAKERLLLVGELGDGGSESSMKEWNWIKTEFDLKPPAQPTWWNVTAMTDWSASGHPEGRIFGVIGGRAADVSI